MSITDNLTSFKIPKLMGILNLTEDSFSDGGYFLAPSAAVAHATKLIKAGADILDIGAESTRPGSKPVPAELEWQRIEPVLAAIKQKHPGIRISIDTQKAEVADKAIAMGVDMINDVSALRFDPEMAKLMAAHPQIELILMHMQGRPDTMQRNPHYEDVISEVLAFLRERAEHAIAQGIARERILIDPGIGFGKNLEHNLQLLAGLDTLRDLGFPVLLGASRKRFIDQLSPSTVEQRMGGSLATTMLACMSKIDIVRVHDVLLHRQFLDVLSAVYKAGV
jgi:dihydropteroate synthase